MSEKFQTVRGMRDFLPEQMRKKQWIEDTCRRVFEKYGFEPLQTPIIEDFGLLAKKGSGGEAVKEEIYYFKDKKNRELGLRFDLTVPLGRVVANNPTLPKPFKRYQIATVYRYDRPQAKRYREFTQADIDTVGSNNILTDFEFIAVAAEIMQQLKLNFYITVSSRTLLEEIAKACSVKPEQIVDCFRCLDKLDKIGENGVKEELKKCNIDSKILSLLKENNLEKIKSKVENQKPVLEMKKLFELVNQSGLEKVVKLDLSLARGLEYYTGPVFEVKIDNGPSVGGGGRYDKLVELYGGQATPATGISFGVDRLVDALEEKISIPSNAQVLVMAFSPAQQGMALQTAQDLRKIGVNTELDLMERSVSKNSDFAKKKGVRFLVIIGEIEAQKGIVSVKDLKENKQFELKSNSSELEKLKEMMG
ncbi:histidine--tRNA ligase [Candidatus Micrarchaeota archaeon]|nr:histidine--tRNA ligase [Candidatus Micrarchaeota archaeon]MBU1930807.1 histidine--tRNA ligase [Candidatus Micrarchaeota archaeon]